MLHENPLMSDIDVDHWRNLQALVLDSAKEKKRIIVIHEKGEILRFAHSHGAEISRNIERVTNPAADAEAIYRANAGKADFAMVVERGASDAYFGQMQDAWSADEDLDEYVHRMFAKMAEIPDGIATYPGPASTRLGLQWRLGASYAAVKTAAERFVLPSSSVVFGIFEGDVMTTSLVLSFDEKRRITVITTADPMDVDLGRGRDAVAPDVVAWVNRKYLPCSLALFTDLASARQFLATPDKLGVLRDLRRSGKLRADPLPDSLARLLSA